MIIGIGTDMVDINRVEELCERQTVENFAKRILTETELTQFETRSSKPETYLAKRFAAKEAIAKAFGTGIGAELSFQDIEISNDEKGKPLVKMENGEPGIEVHLSITDEPALRSSICCDRKNH